MTTNDDGAASRDAWDHSTHADFYDFYANESQSEEAALRFGRVREIMLRIVAETGMSGCLDVVDIGCGAGTQARAWARSGHRVHGLDVNEPLIRLARSRAEEEGLDVRFEVGTATALPWTDRSMDICLLPELLEHVADWQSCLNEADRVLRPGGLLYLSTTNVLCPIQMEFALPLYSWYPGRLKRYCERIAVTTHPKIANHAKYPAVHWFSYYGLRDFLAPRGFGCRDRFDLVDPREKGRLARVVISLVRRFSMLRFLGHVATPSTYLIGVKANHATS